MSLQGYRRVREFEMQAEMSPIDKGNTTQWTEGKRKTEVNMTQSHSLKPHKCISENITKDLGDFVCVSSGQDRFHSYPFSLTALLDSGDTAEGEYLAKHVL